MLHNYDWKWEKRQRIVYKTVYYVEIHTIYMSREIIPVEKERNMITNRKSKS